MRRASAGLAVLLLTLAEPASAATRFVAANGVDSFTCGTKSEPCRSIGRAITNATAGDTIEVGPGRYGDLDDDGVFSGEDGDERAQTDVDCDCMILVDRPLTIVSRDGAGATVLDASDATIAVVRIDTLGVTFGKKGKGFTLTGSSDDDGLDAPRENVRIAGNRAVGNGGRGIAADGNFGFIVIEDNVMEANGDHGLRLDDSDLKLVQRNVSAGNAGDGFSIGNGITTTVNGNLAVANGGAGFELPEGATAKGNAALRNGGAGFELNDRVTVTGCIAHGNGRGFELDDDSVVTKSSIVGNHGFGIVVNGEGNAVGKCSIFGNDDVGDASGGGPVVTNCGLQSLAMSFTAVGNFWGAPTGPGEDPADAFCQDGTPLSAGPFVPFATSEIKVKPKAAK